MNVNPLSRPIYRPSESSAAPDVQNLNNITDKVLGYFPIRTEDKQEIGKLCTLIDKIFLMKEYLSPEKQELVSKFFYEAHGIHPYRDEDISSSETTAKSWISEHSNVNAIMTSAQGYPIPTALLKDEGLSCREYFKSMHVTFGDGSYVDISQGLLAHFSDMVQSMIQNKLMDTENATLTLDKINHHQFDVLIAFLETVQPSLINEENVLPLLYVGDYLQIPEVIESCKTHILQNPDMLDLASIVNLLNYFGPNDPLFAFLEIQISEIINEGLVNDDLSDPFSEQLNFIKTHLKQPIKLSLRKMQVHDQALNHLLGLPISSLALSQCNQLTKNCLKIIEKMAYIQTLNLNGNEWVNDKALEKFPSHIKNLSLTGCRYFSGKGLAHLTHLNSLTLHTCKHLKDADYALLPKQFIEIDLRSCKGIGEKTMLRIGEMDRLQRLILANTSVKAAKIADLPDQLLFLDLTGCPIDNSSCKSIGRMQDLQELLLSKANIDHQGLEDLPLSLARLKIDDCPGIGDKGIAALAKRRNLTSLLIARCFNVSAEAISKLPSSIKTKWQQPPLSRLISV